MRFDPAADPWGTAMLAAAALWLLALLVVVAALLGKTSRRTGGYLMLVSLVVFLGAAAGGTWDRIRQADALVAVAPPAPPEASVPVDSGAAAGESGGPGDEGAGEPGTAAASGSGGPAEGEAATGGEATTGGEAAGTAVAATGDADTGPASTGEAAPDAGTGDATTGDAAAGSTGDAAAGSTGDADPSAGEDTGEPAEPEPAVAVTVPGEPVVPEDLPKVSPLPDEPSAREAAIRDILEDAARAAGGGERCGNLERVATAWARLQTIPVTRKAKSITKDLERCSRRLLYSISRKRLAEMIEARDAWYEKLPTKLRKQHGLIVQSAMSGGSHERLRIGNRELDPERSDALMDAGLREDLVRLQFAHVVLTNGKKSKTYELPVTPEGELGLPWLRAVGLGEPLELPE